jgi:crotonobetainyl-CoA:carnitine CoA-transferase CaiB-like acyl-CoA transferase
VLSPEARPIATADGYICLSANTDAQAHAFFHAIGRPELKADPDFSTVAARTANTARYFALRADALKARGTAEWLAIFAAADVPAMPYNRIADLLHDPQLRASGLVQEGEHPTEGPVFRIGAANRLSGGVAPPAGDAPRIGADGPALLAEAGLAPEDIATLRADGALLMPDHQGGLP